MKVMTNNELQWWIVFSILVAGKTEEFASNVISRLYLWRLKGESLFDAIREVTKNGDLEEMLRQTRSGSYRRLTKCFPVILDLNLRKCSIDDLEAVPGIGPKTARFFLMRTREGVRAAALDTHVLKWLRSKGHATPKSTPTGKRYKELEEIFLSYADQFDMNPVDLDLAIWEHYAKGKPLPPSIV